MALRVSDLDKARGFYRDFLGFDEAHHSRDRDGKAQIAVMKVNENQYIELSDGLQSGRDRLNHISFYTDDAKGLRDYLDSRGIKVPAAAGTGRIGNRSFMVSDPEGHQVEMTEYTPDGWTRRETYMTDRRISKRILHVGIIIGDVPAAMRFYGDVLGLKEFWRGQGRNSETVSWINMRLPDGEDYVEFMLYAEKPAEDKRGSQHHICLEVDDIEAAKARLEAHSYRKTYSRELQINTGVNRRRQLNIYDPDGTRIELMEPRTVDGVPPKSTTAPLPVVRISR
ncbi:MAG: VOC family protein [Blastocatellales bacterium]